MPFPCCSAPRPTGPWPKPSNMQPAASASIWWGRPTWVCWWPPSIRLRCWWPTTARRCISRWRAVRRWWQSSGRPCRSRASPLTAAALASWSGNWRAARAGATAARAVRSGRTPACGRSARPRCRTRCSSCCPDRCVPRRRSPRPCCSEGRGRVTIPTGFEWVHAGRTAMLVRGDVRDWLVPLLLAVARGESTGAGRALSAGRGGAAVLQAQGHQVVLRPYRRGGLPARFLHDRYFGWGRRPLRELRVLEHLRRRGAPVVEPLGACVERVGVASYRGWIVTRYIPEACTLWSWV